MSYWDDDEDDEQDNRDYEAEMRDDDDDQDSRMMFADPGGNSALRAAGPDNPRNLPCPTCGGENRLTPKDVALGYQCNSCADAEEGFGGYGS